MFLKRVKKIAALLMVALTAATSAGAENYNIPEELSSYARAVYADARSYFGGRSFSGYCGTYVRCQLRAMGIFNDQFDFRGNGNQWYSNFENVNMTSGGYYVYRESGSDCVDKLVAKYGDNLSNIVLSFPIQAGYSARYPGAGHAFIIYELRDGIAYYSESFSFGKHREGEVIAEDVNELIARYSRRHGNITGCVMLSRENLSLTLTQRQQELLLEEVRESLEMLSDITIIAEEFTEISQSRVAA